MITINDEHTKDLLDLVNIRIERIEKEFNATPRQAIVCFKSFLMSPECHDAMMTNIKAKSGIGCIPK